MTRYNTYKHSEDFINQIDLKTFFMYFYKQNGLSFLLHAFVSIIAVIFSLSLPNIYQSKALLVPVNSSSGASGALGGYGWSCWSCWN